MARKLPFEVIAETNEDGLAREFTGQRMLRVQTFLDDFDTKDFILWFEDGRGLLVRWHEGYNYSEHTQSDGYQELFLVREGPDGA